MPNRQTGYKDKGKARITFMAQKARYRERTGSGTATNRNQRWSQQDKLRVLQHTIPDRELAEQIGRSVQAIQVMRNKLT